MNYLQKKSRPGFLVPETTFVLLIGFIFVLGMTAATTQVKDNARRTTALSKLRNVGASYKVATDNGSKRIKDQPFSIDHPSLAAARMPDVMQMLAVFGGIEDATQWYLDGDVLNDNFTPPRRVFVAVGGKVEAAPGTYSASISWTTYAPSVLTDESTVPLLWTRGLSEAGRWDAVKDAVWGPAGGHIYFASGRVEWFTDVVQPDTQFISRLTGKGTSSWKEAVSGTFRGRELPAR
jgi:hypothetical protein